MSIIFCGEIAGTNHVLLLSKIGINGQYDIHRDIFVLTPKIRESYANKC